MVCDACVEDKYNKIIREHCWHHNYAEMPSLMANIHRTVLKIMNEKCDDCISEQTQHFANGYHKGFDSVVNLIMTILDGAAVDVKPAEIKNILTECLKMVTEEAKP